MGDRTHVTLTVPKEHEGIVADLCNTDFSSDYYDINDGRFTVFEFEEVNYGNLYDLDKLEAAGIAYESRWSNGGEYSGGQRICRFTDQGALQVIEYHDGEEDPPIAELMKRVDNPEEFARYVREYHAKFQTIPWDNQAEYGKLYQARQLITQGAGA